DNPKRPWGAGVYHVLWVGAGGAFLRVLAAAKSDSTFLSKIAFDMEDVRGKLPADLRTPQIDEYLDGSSTLIELANERLLELLGSPSEELR
ncbi:MAG: hypothetical protein ACK480_03765, partial [Planctomycetota bacterium]